MNDMQAALIIIILALLLAGWYLWPVIVGDDDAP